MSVSFDIKFIRQDQKQSRNGSSPSQSDVFLAKADKPDIKR